MSQDKPPTPAEVEAICAATFGLAWNDMPAESRARITSSFGDGFSSWPPYQEHLRIYRAGVRAGAEELREAANALRSLPLEGGS